MNHAYEPWEDHWRDTLADHEAGPPSGADRAGMEQLLDANPAPKGPSKAPTAGLPNFSALPWPFWAVVLTLTLALGYWLGNRTSHTTSQETESQREETPMSPDNEPDATNMAPPPAPLIDTQFTLDANGNRTDEILTTERAVSGTEKNITPYRPGPEINTPETAGGATSAPPATTPARTSPAPSSPPAGAGAERQSGNPAPAVPRPTAPASDPDMTFSAPKPPVNLNRARYVRPLKTLELPTDRELWEGRVNQLLQSGKLTVSPFRRLDNGYFPAYRLRN